MRTFLVIPLLAIAPLAIAQNVGINSTGAAPAASAMLDVESTNSGVLVPRLALTATNVAAPVAAPAASLLVFNTATAGVAPNNVTPGYYYWNGVQWVRMAGSNDAWLLTGNAGTNPATNFIGTTDAQPWLIKTGGGAAANERIRVLATGQTVVNNTGQGTNTNDVFSVYANGTTNGSTVNTAALGTRGINGYTSTGFGTSGWTSGTTATTYGVFGSATAATGTANAIRGEAFSVNGLAVVGIANTSAGAVPTTTNARGVVGQVNGTLAGTALAIGTQGIINATMTTGDARGVNGSSPSDNGLGVAGFATTAAASGFPDGVYGQAVVGTGFGVEGFNGAATGTGAIFTGNNAGGNFLTNGSGIAVNGNGVGTFSIAKTAASGNGVVGVGNNLLASIFTPAVGSGVVGTGSNYGVVGFATTTQLTNPNNNSAFNGVAASAGGYFEVQAGGVAQTWAYVGVRDNLSMNRKIIGPGTVNTVVRDLEGRNVALSCPEAPENLFQDFGSGQLVNGRAHVELDPILTKNIVVSASHPLRVFVQLEGECNGVYVSNKSATGFDVTELAGGSSNAPFTWTITANRADEVNPDGTIARYSDERFAPAPVAVDRVAHGTRDKPSKPRDPATGMEVTSGR